MENRHRERCSAEMTRDVIFLFQERDDRKSQRWRTLGVWLDRTEAERFGKAHEYRWGVGRWRVYGIPADGVLASILRGVDESKFEAGAVTH